MTDNVKENVKNNVVKSLANVIGWFVSSAFIMWGWNTLAPYINCPPLSYWEIFAIRMALSYTLAIFVKSIKKGRDKNED